MSVRQQQLNKIMHGRINAFQVQQTGSEVIYLNKIKTGNVSVTEEIKSDTTEMVDGAEIIEEYGRKCIAEITYDEVNETDINSINNGDWFSVETESGGVNGTGMIITISGSDSVQASIDGIRTKVVVEKSVSTGLAYTIADNA